MSLIPSESASFPDLLGRGLGASKKSKWRTPFGEDLSSPAPASSRSPSKPAEPRTEASLPPNGGRAIATAAPLPVEQPKLRPVSAAPRLAAPPAPIPKKKESPPANGHSSSLPPIRTALPAPVQPLFFEPSRSEGEAEGFAFPEEGSPWPSIKRRRRARLIRFVVYELFAIAILVGAVMTGLAHRAMDDPLSVVSKIGTILAAVVVAAIPILFYGVPETLPRNRR